MKKAGVQINATYAVRIAGRLAPVTILRRSPDGGWVGRNERTGREVRVRSATKLLHLCAPHPQLFFHREG
ncbi:MAG: hypothetical protein KIT09_30425 [Bryobacteraceae bacterium]|nr:hypothetical protein [Bryobacteraceae bacterium]